MKLLGYNLSFGGRVRSRTPGNACAPSLDLKSRRPTGDETLPYAMLIQFCVAWKVNELS